jgi:hypothetical protein
MLSVSTLSPFLYTTNLHPPSQSTPLAALSDNEKPNSRKMQQEGQGKYQLFPKGRQSPSFNSSASVDPETAFAMAMNKNSEWNEKPGATQALKIKVNQQTIGRRRKVTIPELGPMTTVQEITMDSRKIPSPLQHPTLPL